MLSWPPKDPDEVLDYQIDWADAVNGPRLESDETLSTSSFSVVEGTVVVQSQTFVASGKCTVWLTGGTIGERCIVRNRVTTSKGRTYDEAVRLRIRSKE